MKDWHGQNKMLSCPYKDKVRWKTMKKQTEIEAEILEVYTEIISLLSKEEKEKFFWLGKGMSVRLKTDSEEKKEPKAGW